MVVWITAVRGWRVNKILRLSKLQAMVLVLAVAVVGGLAGLLALLLCHWVLRFGGGDAADKHGISSAQSARVGGVLIAVYVLCYLVALYVFEFRFGWQALVMIGGVFGFFALGLYEDLFGLLSPRFRLVAMLLIATLVMLLAPQLVVTQTGLAGLDGLLAGAPWLAFVCSVLGLVYVVNAFNTADGANGLCSGIGLFALFGLSLVAGASRELVQLEYAVILATFIFVLINLSSGRFFLGDGGAYFLGAVITLCIMQLVGSGAAPLGQLAVLVAYPVIDLLWSMLRRTAAGQSPFGADNQHLHNRLHARLLAAGLPAGWANTATGLLVVAGFGALPQLAGWQFLAAGDTLGQWLGLVFIAILYVLVWALLRPRAAVGAD